MSKKINYEYDFKSFTAFNKYAQGDSLTGEAKRNLLVYLDKKDLLDEVEGLTVSDAGRKTYETWVSYAEQANVFD